jgi:hypothetical protein
MKEEHVEERNFSMSYSEKDGHDVCECGDYRRSHKDGTGACAVCASSMAPYDGCVKFRPVGQQLSEQCYAIAERFVAKPRRTKAADAIYALVREELEKH